MKNTNAHVMFDQIGGKAVILTDVGFENLKDDGTRQVYEVDLKDLDIVFKPKEWVEKVFKSVFKDQ